MLIIYLELFVLGTVFASFMHLYVTRLLKEESIVSPRSHCTKCKHVLKWYELIPILSYIMQKGKCRNCGVEIGKDSLIVEIITGLLFVLTYMVFGYDYKTLIGLILVLVLISVFLSDFKEMIILDSTLLVGTLLVYIFIFLEKGFFGGVNKSFLYGVFAFVLMFLVKIWGDAFFKRESLGGGDIKLAFLMGSVLPHNLFLVALVVGSTCALPYALYISITSKTNELAFGPFLALGMYVTFLLQNNIIELLNFLTG